MSTDTLPEITVMADLSAWLAENAATTGRPPSPLEVLALVSLLADALARLHARGCAHGDLRPETVFVEGDRVRLSDPLAGGDFTRSAYTAPERNPGQPAVPRHDLYALGVLWAKLLTGDLAFELHPGWARELEVRCGVPKVQLGLIEKCVGWVGDRPSDAVELSRLLHHSLGKLAP
jgi:serine/threonine protein kinase